MPSRATDWMRACMEATSTSLASWLLTSSRRSTGSAQARMVWASATFMRRLEATRSASLPGSSTLDKTPRMSGEEMPRRFMICSLCSLAARIMASCSEVSSSISRSSMSSTRAAWCGVSEVNSSTRARETPCTRIFRRPSGILSMRMMVHTVPTSCMSSWPGSSIFSSLWVRTRM